MARIRVTGTDNAPIISFSSKNDNRIPLVFPSGFPGSSEYNRRVQKPAPMPSIVAFDLETTGLDPKSDAIIEIAMVRFDENGTVEEFSSLVNPGISISEEVENITGITDEDVSEAPGF